VVADGTSATDNTWRVDWRAVGFRVEVQQAHIVRFTISGYPEESQDERCHELIFCLNVQPGI